LVNIKIKTTVFSSKEGRMIGARNPLHVKVTTKTYETDYEVPCTAGILTDLLHGAGSFLRS
jgi:hypothetical protein